MTRKFEEKKRKKQATKIIADDSFQVALQRPLERLVGRKVRGSMVSAITSNRGLTSAHAVGLLAAVLGNERIDRLFE